MQLTIIGENHNWEKLNIDIYISLLKYNRFLSEDIFFFENKIDWYFKIHIFATKRSRSKRIAYLYFFWYQ